MSSQISTPGGAVTAASPGFFGRGDLHGALSTTSTPSERAELARAARFDRAQNPETALGPLIDAERPAETTTVRIHIPIGTALFGNFRGLGGESDEVRQAKETAMAAAMSKTIKEDLQGNTTDVLDDSLRSVMPFRVGDMHTGLYDVTVRAATESFFTAWCAYRHVMVMPKMPKPSCYIVLDVAKTHLATEIDHVMGQLPVEGGAR